MKKQTKLTEKATRIPDIRQWGEIITRYLVEVEPCSGETARSTRFGMFMQELLGFQPGFIESYISGIEKYLKAKQKDRILKGEADNLFGNVIIEFEGNIPKKQSEAEEQLRRYTAILWSGEPPEARTPYLCIATDGVRFITYSPILPKPKAKDVSPEDVHLETLEKADWTKLKPEEVFYWLDRYFLRKEVLHPTTEAIEHDFGPKSHAFKTTTHTLLTLWQEIKSKSEFAVIYDGWEKYLRIVYGSEVAGDELFVRHTYLATLAKLMAWMRISESRSLPDEPQTIQMLEGQLFKAQGIENFIEEDFFSWLARAEATKVGVGISSRLFSLLQNYNLRELSEDVLKSLYQELVDPQTRHDLGEFYTPDWLAQRMVEKALKDNPRASVLDPACGSGTFLYMTVKYKREALGNSLQTLEHILTSTAGIEIHPLAVTIARTNYILALGELLKRRKGRIQIPIYMANSIKLPERELLKEYELYLDHKQLLIAEVLIQGPQLYDEAIEASREFARSFSGQEADETAFLNLLRRRSPEMASRQELLKAIFPIARVMKELVEENRDTIWAFILKNIFKPLFLKQKFDVLLGNPPWLSYRYVEKGEYQDFLKIRITRDYHLLSGKAELITHMELASLFFLRSAELYLREEGLIGFVLPRSIFTADQHDAFRRGEFSFPMALKEAWDLEGVSPLFNVPACVFFAIRKGKTKYPLSCEVISGELKRKNANLAGAEKDLNVSRSSVFYKKIGKRSFLGETPEGIARQGPSYYRPYFKEGATIVPRTFWFVDIKSHPTLGLNPEKPYVETAQAAERTAKEAYKDVKLGGNIEGEFLYATLLSADLLPFGHLDYRLAVLPVLPSERNYRLIKAEEARREGYLGLAHWLDKAQKEWTKRRGEKAGKMDIYQRLDYTRGITGQDRMARYRVLYPASATYLCGCVIQNHPIKIKIEGQGIKIQGFVVESKAYCYQTDNKADAYYLSSVLSSFVLDKLIKPMQSRGQWGPRDIHKKLLELPIPRFDPKDKAHLRLAGLGEGCSEKVDRWLAGGGAGNIKSIGRLRGMVRETLKEELGEIDGLVKEIL